MVGAACQHDPAKPNPTVSPIEQSSSYLIMYCSVCKKTEIAPLAKPARPPREVSPSLRAVSPSPQAPEGLRKVPSKDESSDGSDNEDEDDEHDADVAAVKSNIDDIYQKLAQLKV